MGLIQEPLIWTDFSTAMYKRFKAFICTSDFLLGMSLGVDHFSNLSDFSP